MGAMYRVYDLQLGLNLQVQPVAGNTFFQGMVGERSRMKKCMRARFLLRYIHSHQFYGFSQLHKFNNWTTSEIIKIEIMEIKIWFVLKKITFIKKKAH